MEVSDFKTLLNQIKCGEYAGLGFTEDDLEKVKSCISNSGPIEALTPDPVIEIDDTVFSCIPGAVESLNNLLKSEQSNLIVGIKQSILRTKVQELRDNLEFVKTYVDTRYSFLVSLINLYQSGGSGAVSQAIQNLEALPEVDTVVVSLLKSNFNKISGQIEPDFYDRPSFEIAPRISNFSFRLINKNQVTVDLFNPETQATETTIVKIFESSYLTKNVFENTPYFFILDQENYDPAKNSPLPREHSDYEYVPGLLYNGTDSSDYLGLYKKLSKPLTYLFTLEERGLTLSESLVDPFLKKISDVPTSVDEWGVKYYIANQSTYEQFYQNLEITYLDRVANERSVVFPLACSAYLDSLRNLAKREVADIVRKSLYNWTYDLTSIIKVRDYFYEVNYKITELLRTCDFEISTLTQSILQNSMSESSLKNKVSDISCFSRAVSAVPEVDPICEGETATNLGTDPLYIRTLSQATGDFPDPSTQCYWKEFAKSLNRLSLLPFPDLSGPPPNNLGFRYWPINCVIPAGIALVLLPIPPVWKPLFVLPTQLGTLVCFLTMPIAPIGIPLPSVFLFYFAPDSTKYLIAAVNLPSLYSNPKNLTFGFDLDTSSLSQNPLGLFPNNSYKGYPIKGAFLTPLTVSATSSRAERLAQFVADLVAGRLPKVTNLNGEELPFSILPDEYKNGILSENEIALKILDADPSEEFERQVTQLKTMINKQIEKLGNMQTPKIDVLRQKVRTSRKSAVAEAEKLNSLSARRLGKKAAREFTPIGVSEKIDSTVSSFNDYIDNITFGTIRFPKDATKNNPGLPEAVNAVVDLITMSSLGDTNIEESATNLNLHVKKALAKVNVKSLAVKEKFDLSVQSDLEDLKTTLKNLSDETISYLKGDSIEVDVSSAKTEEERIELIASSRSVQETARDALAFTAVALANPPKITLFDFSKKCCEVKSQPVFSPAQPLVSMSFGVLSALMQVLIDNLEKEDIVKMVGTETKEIGLSFVTTLFDEMVSAIPKVSLPDPSNLFSLIQSFLLPVLTALSIPKAYNPLQPPAISIVIPLDPIFKPIIKSLIAGLLSALFEMLDQVGATIEQTSNFLMKSDGSGSLSGETTADREVLRQVFSQSCGFGTTLTVALSENRVIVTGDGEVQLKQPEVLRVSLVLPNNQTVVLPDFPFLSLDIYGYFQLITGFDIIELVKQLVDIIFDLIIAPLKISIEVISKLAVSLNTFSYNVIEAAIPILSMLKLAKMTIDSQIPQSVKLKIINPEFINLFQISIIPAMQLAEPVLKEIAWLGTVALCSIASPITNYQTVSVARMVHPIINSDDLPVWERLTHKNPLFCIFLDELAWRGSLYSTGSLIFQTKTPAVLPYSPIFPIVHVTPHLF